MDDCPGRYTFQASDDGVKTFHNVVFNQPGSFDLWVSEISSDSPDGHWKFDEGEGDIVVDFSGNWMNATLFNAGHTWVDGAPALTDSSAISLNGTDSYAVVQEDGVDLSNKSFSIAFWAKRSKSGGQWIISQGTGATSKGLHIGFRNNHTFTFAFYADDLDVNVDLDNEWHHWAVTYDKVSGNQRIYKDGSLIGTPRKTEHGDLQSSGSLYIGKRFDKSDSLFGGDLDDMRVYYRALSDSEIAALTSSGAAVPFWHKAVTVKSLAEIPNAGNSGLTNQVQDADVSKRVTLTFAVKNAADEGLEGFSADDFSVSVDGGPAVTFSNHPFSSFTEIGAGRVHGGIHG